MAIMPPSFTIAETALLSNNRRFCEAAMRETLLQRCQLDRFMHAISALGADHGNAALFHKAQWQCNVAIPASIV
jgi:hypothetical protein